LNISFHIIYFAVLLLIAFSGTFRFKRGHPEAQPSKNYERRYGTAGHPGARYTAKTMVYCLYVGNRREKSVSRRLLEVKNRGYSINIVGEYPGYLEVESNLTEELLSLIFRGCGVRRVCGN
jgi:hypothetical protein